MGKAAVVLEAWRNNVESVYRVVERLSRLASRAVGLLTSACRAKAKWRYTCHGSGARRWSVPFYAFPPTVAGSLSTYRSELWEDPWPSSVSRVCSGGCSLPLTEPAALISPMGLRYRMRARAPGLARADVGDGLRRYGDRAHPRAVGSRAQSGSALSWSMSATFAHGTDLPGVSQSAQVGNVMILRQAPQLVSLRAGRPAASHV
jgi:hypothetical protein